MCLLLFLDNFCIERYVKEKTCKIILLKVNHCFHPVYCWWFNRAANLLRPQFVIYLDWEINESIEFLNHNTQLVAKDTVLADMEPSFSLEAVKRKTFGNVSISSGFQRFPRETWCRFWRLHPLDGPITKLLRQSIKSALFWFLLDFFCFGGWANVMMKIEE